MYALKKLLCAWACANICLCKEADGCVDTAVYMAKPRLVNSAGGAARRPGQPARPGARRAVRSGVNSQLRDALRFPLRPRPSAPEVPGCFLTRAAFGETVRCSGSAGLNSPFAAPARPLSLAPAAAAVRVFVRPRPCCAASDAAARPLCPRPPLRSAGVRL